MGQPDEQSVDTPKTTGMGEKTLASPLTFPDRSLSSTVAKNAHQLGHSNITTDAIETWYDKIHQAMAKIPANMPMYIHINYDYIPKRLQMHSNVEYIAGNDKLDQEGKNLYASYLLDPSIATRDALLNYPPLQRLLREYEIGKYLE